MKRLVTAGSLLGLVAGVVLMVSSGAFAAAPKPAGIGAHFPNGTYTVALDGFCNVIELVKPGSGGAPSVQATDNGCGTTHTFVGVAANGVGMAWTDVGNLYIVIKGNHTWINYMDCGSGTECVQNSGTWSSGAAPVQRGLPDAAAARSAPFGGDVQRFPVPNAAFDLSFDGFCDGEHLNLPGSAGTPGVDGTETGCQVNPLIGARFSGPSSAGMWDYTGGFFYVIKANHTWTLFVDSGGGVSSLLNSGTWSNGPPAAPQGNRTLVPSSLRH